MSELSERLRAEQNLCALMGDKFSTSLLDEAAQRIEELERDVESFEADRPFHEAQRKKIKRLEDRCRDETARAEQAERELDAANSAHRAMAKQLADTGRKLEEAVGLLRPFAEFDHAMTSDQPENCIIVRGRILSVLTLKEFEAARQFVQAQEGR